MQKIILRIPGYMGHGFVEYAGVEIGALAVVKVRRDYSLYHAGTALCVQSLAPQRHKQKELIAFAQYIQEACPEAWEFVNTHADVFMNKNKHPGLVEQAVAHRAELLRVSGEYWKGIPK